MDTEIKVEMREINSLMGKIDGAYHDVITRLGLSESEFSIFYLICEEGEGCCQSVLYKKSGRGKTTINSAIKKMKENGLLYLERGKGNNTLVYLTDAGRERMKEKVWPVIRAENEIVRSLTKEEHQNFVEANQWFLDTFLEKTKDI